MISFSLFRDKGYCTAYSNITQVSENIKIFTKYNMTAEIFENSESTNCTKAVFRGSVNSWSKFTKFCL